MTMAMKHLPLLTALALCLSGCDAVYRSWQDRLASFTQQKPVAVFAPKTRMVSANRYFEVTGTGSCPKGPMLAILPDLPFCTVILPDTAIVTAFVRDLDSAPGSEADVSVEKLTVERSGEEIRLRRGDGTLLAIAI